MGCNRWDAAADPPSINVSINTDGFRLLPPLIANWLCGTKSIAGVDNDRIYLRGRPSSGGVATPRCPNSDRNSSRLHWSSVTNDLNYANSAAKSTGTMGGGSSDTLAANKDA